MPDEPQKHSTAAYPPRCGPRERLLLQGARELTDGDLLAVLLGTGSTREPAPALAARLLAEQGGLHGLRRCSPRALAETRGVGTCKSARLLAALELGMRASIRPFHPSVAVECSRDVDAALGGRLRGERCERLIALALDTRHRPMAEILVAVGSLDSCGFTPADAFRQVVAEAAPAVLFVHNHPSGDSEPSPEDRAITRRLFEVAELLGIRMLDHIIVGARDYFSFCDAGLLPRVGASTGLSRKRGAYRALVPSSGAEAAASRRLAKK